MVLRFCLATLLSFSSLSESTRTLNLSFILLSNGYPFLPWMGSMKTLKFKFYKHKRNRYRARTINAAWAIYNHCIALHKRYYRMWGKDLNCAKLQSHVAKLRKRNPLWQSVGSQAVQDICQRIDKAYQLLFKHKKKVRSPGFKKVKKYKSFTININSGCTGMI